MFLESQVNLGSENSTLLCWSCAKRTWRGGSSTGDSDRHVKEGSGNGASHSIQRLSQGNMVGGLLYWYSGSGAFIFIRSACGKPKDVSTKNVQNILHHSIFSNVLHNSLIIFIG
jgi:hypothetical protein